MELINASAIFTQTMNNLFSNMLDSGVAVFLDDILVYSPMVEKHFILLEKYLAFLHQDIFYYKLKKCSFLCNSTMHLGFNITPKQIFISDSKEQNLNKWLHYNRISTVILRICTVFPYIYMQFWCHCSIFAKANIQEYVICTE